MLFTDGLPTINPPRGILPTLKRWSKPYFGGKLPTISTYGFGYELDSEQLQQIAIIGSGAYNFIPDSSFVGTVFVNAVSNLLVMVAKDVELTLEPQRDATFVGSSPFLGGHPVDGNTLRLGTLHFGQPYRVVVRMKVPQTAAAGYLKATLKYAHRGTPRDGALQVKECTGEVHPTAMPDLVGPEVLRLHVVDALREVTDVLKITETDRILRKERPLGQGMSIVMALIAELKSSRFTTEESVAGLIQDLEGHVKEALTRLAWYEKWGIHYFPSLMFAHLQQQCNNFKDPGVQAYGGELFRTIRTRADDAFVNLGATVASHPSVTQGAGAVLWCYHNSSSG